MTELRAVVRVRPCCPTCGAALAMPDVEWGGQRIGASAIAPRVFADLRASVTCCGAVVRAKFWETQQ